MSWNNIIPVELILKEREMTSNKLADKFKNRESHWKLINYIVWAEQAETMLRQQAQEIKALKEELKRYADAIGEERGNKALRNNEIAEILTKVLDDCGLLKKASKK